MKLSPLALTVLAAFLFALPDRASVAQETKGQAAQSPTKTSAEKAQPKKKFQFVLHVSDHDSKQWEQALQNAEAMQRNMGRENVDVEIVANGYGLEMLKSNNEKFAPLINAALDRSVDVVACGETMQRTGVKKEDLVGGVRVVKGGLPEIALKVRAGYTYIKPRFGRAPASGPDRWHLEPAPLLPAREPEFRELDAFRAFHEIPGEVAFPCDVLQEEFPLDLEGVLAGDVVGHLLPAGIKVDGLRNIRVPNGFRRIHPGLREAAS